MHSFKSIKTWGKVLTAMVTPFDQNGKVYYSEIERLAYYLIDEQKNDGLVLCGSTGESSTLKDEEKFKILEVVLNAVGTKANIIFGAGSNSTEHSIYLAQQAEALGAHGLMIVNPYYNKPCQKGLAAHFGAIAKSTQLGIMLYNISSRTGVNLATSTLLKLIQDYPNIIAVKEASGDINQISEVCRLVPKDFLVYSGDDALTLPVLSLGGYGVVGVVTHIVGKEMKQMINCFESSPVRAREIHHFLSPFIKAAFVTVNPTPIKYMLEQKGFLMGKVRLPLVDVDDQQKEYILNFIKDL